MKRIIILFFVFGNSWLGAQEVSKVLKIDEEAFIKIVEKSAKGLSDEKEKLAFTELSRKAFAAYFKAYSRDDYSFCKDSLRIKEKETKVLKEKISKLEKEKRRWASVDSVNKKLVFLRDSLIKVTADLRKDLEKNEFYQKQADSLVLINKQLIAEKRRLQSCADSLERSVKDSCRILNNFRIKSSQQEIHLRDAQSNQGRLDSLQRCFEDLSHRYREDSLVLNEVRVVLGQVIDRFDTRFKEFSNSSLTELKPAEITAEIDAVTPFLVLIGVDSRLESIRKETEQLKNNVKLVIAVKEGMNALGTPFDVKRNKACIEILNENKKYALTEQKKEVDMFIIDLKEQERYTKNFIYILGKLEESKVVPDSKIIEKLDFIKSYVNAATERQDGKYGVNFTYLNRSLESLNRILKEKPGEIRTDPKRFSDFLESLKSGNADK